jgi:DNA-binding transcriptional regulator YiaG
MRCPSCNRTDEFRPWEGALQLLGVALPARGVRCTGCGEIVLEASEVERHEGELAAALVARGIRTGPEFELVRKMTGLRVNEIAGLLGVHPETVSSWERGELELPRTAAAALGELYEQPALTRQKLAAFVE